MRVFRDIQFAIRTLARSPGFSTVVVLTLGLGIGASTAIFNIVNTVVLRPLDYPRPEQLVRITSASPRVWRDGYRRCQCGARGLPGAHGSLS